MHRNNNRNNNKNIDRNANRNRNVNRIRIRNRNIDRNIDKNVNTHINANTNTNIDTNIIFASLLILIILVVSTLYMSFSTSINDHINNRFYPNKMDDKINYINFLISDKKTKYENINNFFNEDDLYFILSKKSYLVIVKEDDYINSYKGENLLGLKILDLSNNEINESEFSIRALEDSITETQDMILKGDLKNNKIDNFYKIAKNYNLSEGDLVSLTKDDNLSKGNLVSVKGYEVEDTILKFLDEYLLEIQNDKENMIKDIKTSKIISNIDVFTLIFTMLFAGFTLLLIPYSKH